MSSVAEKLARKSNRRPPAKQVRLRLVYVDFWSAVKLSFLVAVCFAVISIVVTFLIHTVLSSTGIFEQVNSLVQDHTAGQGSLEVIDLKSHQEGEHTIDDEISQKTERLGLSHTTPAVATAPAPTPAPAAISPAAAMEAKKTRPCSTCGGDLGTDANKYREHFRSEWHRYNLKRKSKKQPVISEEEFDALDTEDVEVFLSSMS